MFAGDGPEVDDWLSSCREVLDRYFTLEDPRRLEPAERELYVEALLESGLLLRGFVDRVDVAPGGQVRVVDYKTGRSPGPAWEAKALFQMKFYALVIWRTRGVSPRDAAAGLPRQRRDRCATPPTRPTCSPPSARSRRSGRPSGGPRRAATGAPAPAGCATGVPTRHCARRSTGCPRPCRWSPARARARPGRRRGHRRGSGRAALREEVRPRGARPRARPGCGPRRRSGRRRRSGAP